MLHTDANMLREDKMRQMRHGRPQKFFQGGAMFTFCLSFSGFWRCSANRCSQNVLPFLHHKENAQCYGNGCKQCSL